ncbi:unnamed protein product [Rotaria sp. Silwood1]|nr:unnamed protein product [Rotaria sp. Silwood1]CAF3540719.1 unnamed protein product [Rotaria sp. Silwood1]CAF4667467.1 unnamed protein product [Rotaria sp. Silwood1]
MNGKIHPKVTNVTMNRIGDDTDKVMIILGISLYILERKVNGNILINRTNNSSLYLLTSSCANLIQIFYPLLINIIFDGFQYPKTNDNVFLTCKLPYYILYTSDLVSLTCICLAILDRYVISSREVRLRRLSIKRHVTKKIIFSIICIFALHNIPIIIYYEVSPIGNCKISSRIYSYYYLGVFQIFFHGIFLICFLSIFSRLIYKQLKMTQQISYLRNFNSDKQLSRMLLLLCITILMASIPYSMENIYSVFFIDFTQKLSSYARVFNYTSIILFFTDEVLSFYVCFSFNTKFSPRS